MKSLVLLGFVCALVCTVRANADEDEDNWMWAEHLKDSVKTCAKELGLAEKDFKAMVKETWETHECPRQLGCMHSCILRHLGMMNEKHEIDMSAVKKWLKDKMSGHEDKMKMVVHVLEKCHDEVRKKHLDDECDIGAAHMTCVLHHFADHDF